MYGTNPEDAGTGTIHECLLGMMHIRDEIKFRNVKTGFIQSPLSPEVRHRLKFHSGFNI